MQCCVGVQKNCVDQGGLGEAGGGMGGAGDGQAGEEAGVVDEAVVIGTPAPRRGRS